MRAQGTRIPVLLTVLGGVDLFNQYVPFVIARDVRSHEDATPASQGYPDPAGWFDQHVAPFVHANPGAYAYQGYGLNEWYPGNQASLSEVERWANWYMDYMRRASERGARVTFADLAVGNVGTPQAGEPNHLSALRPMLALGEQLGHVFNYHAYSDPHNPYDMVTGAEWYAMRWLPWVKDYPRLRIVFGEAGPIDMKFGGPDVGFPGVEQTLEMWQQFQGMIEAAVQRGDLQRGQVIGAAWWTLGVDPRWTRFDYAPALPALEEWAAR
jgi:hypothetical protein